MLFLRERENGLIDDTHIGSCISFIENAMGSIVYIEKTSGYRFLFMIWRLIWKEKI